MALWAEPGVVHAAFFEDASGDVTLTGPEAVSIVYTAYSRAAPDDPERLRAAGNDYPEWVAEVYLALPPQQPAVAALARTVAGEAPTPYDAALALVGHFPFIPRLREQVGQLWVIEQRPVEGDYPAEAAAELIPQADVVAVTSSALINHTMDGLLALCPSNALVMALGPSTPLSPVLFKHGINFLSGSRVVDEAAVLRTVGQGASFQQVQGVRLLTFFRSGDRI